MFKLVKGKDGTTSFLPIDHKTGGKISYIQNKEAMCLTEKQASYFFPKYFSQTTSENYEYTHFLQS